MSKLMRAEARRKERVQLKNSATYNLNNKQLNELSKQIYNETKDKIKAEVSSLVMTNTISACMYMLVEDFQFGKKRLEKFVDRFNDEFIAIQKGYVTLSDWQQVLVDKGIDVKKLFSNILKEHEEVER